RTVPVLLAGTVLLSTAPVWLALSSSLLAVTAGSAMLGFGHIVFMLGGQGMISAISAEDRLDRNFGLFTAGVSTGQMLGPLAAGALLGTASGAELLSSTTTALLLAGAAAAAGLVPVVVLLQRTARNTPHRDLSSREGTGQRTITLLRRRGMATSLFSSLALLGAVDLLTAYLPLIAEERGIAPTIAGALLAVRSAASILSRLSLGALAARWHRRPLITTSSLVAGLCLAAVTVPVNGVLAIGLALAVGGFFLGIGQPLTMTAVVRAGGTEQRGAA